MRDIEVGKGIAPGVDEIIPVVLPAQASRSSASDPVPQYHFNELSDQERANRKEFQLYLTSARDAYMRDSDGERYVMTLLSFLKRDREIARDYFVSNMLISSNETLGSRTRPTRALSGFVSELLADQDYWLPTAKRGYIARVGKCLGEMNILDVETFNTIKNILYDRAESFSGAHLAGLAYAFGELRIGTAELAQRLLQAAIINNEWEDSDSKILFSYGIAMMGERDDCSAVIRWLNQELTDFSMLKKPNQALKILDRVIKAYQLESELSEFLADSINTHRMIAVIKSRRTNAAPESNVFEKAVENILGLIGVRVSGQKYIAGEFVDLVLIDQKVPTIIECDDASFHRVNRDPRNLLIGKDLLKERLLEHAGYRVVRVDHATWRGASDRAEYLRRLLAD